MGEQTKGKNLGSKTSRFFSYSTVTNRTKGAPTLLCHQFNNASFEALARTRADRTSYLLFLHEEPLGESSYHGIMAPGRATMVFYTHPRIWAPAVWTVLSAPTATWQIFQVVTIWMGYHFKDFSHHKFWFPRSLTKRSASLLFQFLVQTGCAHLSALAFDGEERWGIKDIQATQVWLSSHWSTSHFPFSPPVDLPHYFQGQHQDIADLFLLYVTIMIFSYFNPVRML